MSGRDELRELLRRIDGRGYRAYKDLARAYDLQSVQLFVDHVQGDPFATPSKLRLRVPMTRARLPADLFDTPVRALALRDYLAREARRAIARVCAGGQGSGKSGAVSIDAGGQAVLDRAAVALTTDWVEARVTAGLPARGRSVLGRQAAALLADELPEVANAALEAEALDLDEARAFVDCVDNQAALRAQLVGRGLVAFIADGSVLPRASGARDTPLDRDAVPWRSPESLAVTLEVPHGLPDGRRALRGTGIRRGVTLIVGGGYHGKSTVLKALERAVYPHVPGDGREYVVTDPDAVKIRAEDGRGVARVDISPFIDRLPQGRDTRAFCSDDASGSTSQAANIMEAVELGARALLLDEDTSATNFMVRDARMQALVHADHEPITPLVDRIRELFDVLSVSTVLVMGGSGDYFEVADTVLMMRDFVPSDVTEAARRIAAERPSQRRREAKGTLRPPQPRVPVARSLDPSRGRRDLDIKARGLDRISFGAHEIDLRQVEQLIDVSQVRAVGYALALARRHMGGGASVREVLEAVQAVLDAEGLDVLDPYRRRGHHPGSFARPRRFEIAAALNRLRALEIAAQGR